MIQKNSLFCKRHFYRQVSIPLLTGLIPSSANASAVLIRWLWPGTALLWWKGWRKVFFPSAFNVQPLLIGALKHHLWQQLTIPKAPHLSSTPVYSHFFHHPNTWREWKQSVLDAPWCYFCLCPQMPFVQKLLSFVFMGIPTLQWAPGSLPGKHLPELLMWLGSWEELHAGEFQPLEFLKGVVGVSVKSVLGFLNMV